MDKRYFKPFWWAFDDDIELIDLHPFVIIPLTLVIVAFIVIGIGSFISWSFDISGNELRFFAVLFAVYYLLQRAVIRKVDNENK